MSTPLTPGFPFVLNGVWCVEDLPFWSSPQSEGGVPSRDCNILRGRNGCRVSLINVSVY